tara:strand:+ start:161 stop:1048 length:888 start_codon:yes stop_codon:yes gene_type:complete
MRGRWINRCFVGEESLKKQGNKNLSEIVVLPVFSLAAFIAVSLFIHTVFFLGLPVKNPLGLDSKSPKKLKVRLVEKTKKTDDAKKILESKLEKTEKPEKADFKGYQNHKTKKETKVKRVISVERALDPGSGGQGKKNIRKRKLRRSNRVPTLNRGVYSSLLPRANQLDHELAKGYQDYIEDDMEIGDRIDINTADYRYISYFTSMRKAIELVWNYPPMAIRRGQHGAVGLQFTIFKNGTVKNLRIVNSSGYSALDNAIVEAIKISSPFSPLPRGLGKSKMTITGTFNYILNSYAH